MVSNCVTQPIRYDVRTAYRNPNTSNVEGSQLVAKEPC